MRAKIGACPARPFHRLCFSSINPALRSRLAVAPVRQAQGNAFASAMVTGRKALFRPACMGCAQSSKLDDVLTCEARAGASFFMQFRGSEMRFCDAVPDHWHTFTARAGTFLPGKRGTSKARYAAAPLPAMLNYAYTVALGQCTRAIIGAGLDACHGFLHSPKPGRLSLSYDVLECHRADLTRAVFSFGGKRVFCRDDFEQDNRGIVRLGAPVAREVAALALRAAPMGECVKSVRRLSAMF
jgi:hypothetical protein